MIGYLVLLFFSKLGARQQPKASGRVAVGWSEQQHHGEGNKEREGLVAGGYGLRDERLAIRLLVLGWRLNRERELATREEGGATVDGI
ncbi:hypothetical protein PR202_ga09312 [Eleusine coracana subsp. coracana]|uniref:Secreted protein n=1 Tax=Eleusine coracana subsp. coracana TaxID=191504 RepID=A0AAV5C4E3_ELECO|nr:hypothetical protein PR202_ga09312 [Eleusine coracana subsp. coracana]